LLVLNGEKCGPVTTGGQNGRGPAKTKKTGGKK